MRVLQYVEEDVKGDDDEEKEEEEKTRMMILSGLHTGERIEEKTRRERVNREGVNGCLLAILFLFDAA